jgi:methionyl-tRNA formyltransferase
LSVVYLGTSGFAAAILEQLAGTDAGRPALVITRPDRPSGRGRQLSSPPVAEAARKLGLTLAQPDSVNTPAVAEAIAGMAGPEGPPTVVVCAFGALITEPLLSAAEILNVHPSLLPRWRGAAPIERAIMAGDERTGVGIMRLAAGLDSGPVCVSGEQAIAADDTYGSLAERLQQLGAELLLRALRERPPFREQEEAGVTYAEKITPADRLLDTARPAVELERKVRALHPHIGARLQVGADITIGVRRAALASADSAAGERGASEIPEGSLSAEGERLLLGCATGVLELLEVQPPGGRPMDAAAYLRGHGLPGRR